MTDNLDQVGRILHESGTNSRDIKTDHCEDHPDAYLSLYCHTCTGCVCHKCALWGGHKDHQLEDLNQVSQKKEEEKEKKKKNREGLISKTYLLLCQSSCHLFSELHFEDRVC